MMLCKCPDVELADGISVNSGRELAVSCNMEIRAGSAHPHTCKMVSISRPGTPRPCVRTDGSMQLHLLARLMYYANGSPIYSDNELILALAGQSPLFTKYYVDNIAFK